MYMYMYVYSYIHMQYRYSKTRVCASISIIQPLIEDPTQCGIYICSTVQYGTVKPECVHPFL